MNKITLYILEIMGVTTLILLISVAHLFQIAFLIPLNSRVEIWHTNYLQKEYVVFHTNEVFQTNEVFWMEMRPSGLADKSNQNIPTTK